MSCGGLLVNGGLVDAFYMNSGASDHLVSSQGELCAYRRGDIGGRQWKDLCLRYQHSTRGSIFNRLKQEQDIHDVYYVRTGFHVRLPSLGKL